MLAQIIHSFASLENDSLGLVLEERIKKFLSVYGQRKADVAQSVFHISCEDKGFDES